MNREYQELLKSLEEGNKIIQVQGLDILIKEIPDSDQEGILDPRVLKVKKIEKETRTEFGHSASLEEIRAGMGWPNEDVTGGKIITTKRKIEGKNGIIPVRIYTPREEKQRPCIVFFHGGGFFGGTLDCVENPCKCLAEAADAVVVSADYRLAPEHPFPKGAEDCFDVVDWVYENSLTINADKDKIGVSGDSAGGNLAAVCTLMDRNSGMNRIKFQALLYPVVDVGQFQKGYQWSLDSYCIREQNEFVMESITALGKGGEMLIRLYLNGNKELTKEEYVSPLFAKDVSTLPPTLIINGEYDYLRLEGEAYGRKLKEAGVPVKMIRYNGMDHAFMDKIGLYPQAENAMREIGDYFLSII